MTAMKKKQTRKRDEDIEAGIEGQLALQKFHRE